MKQNKKGFTLIELLAVIVILAIIALIATPIILNMINDAKKSAAVDSAYGYTKAVETYVSMSSMSGASNGTLATEYSTALPTGYNTPTGVTCVKGEADGTDNVGCSAFITALEATVKGTLPAAGSTLKFANGSLATGTVLKYDAGDVNFDGKTATLAS